MLLIYYLLVNFIWGVGPIINKYLLNYMDVITLMLIMSVLYLFMVLLLAIKNKDKIVKDFINIKKYKYLLLFLTLFSILLIVSNYGYLYLINNSNTALATILTSLYPIITLIIGYKLLKEKMTKIELIGFLLILSGIILINYSKKKYKT